MASAEKMQELVDALCGMDETSIITVISSVLQARPETAPAVVAFAVPDLTYTPYKALKDKRCQGVVKSYSEQKGFGFVECDELKAAFGNDVFVHSAQFGTCRVGMSVNFAVMLNKDNKPQAFDLQPVGAAHAGPSEEGSSWGRWGKGGKDDGGSWGRWGKGGKDEGASWGRWGKGGKEEGASWGGWAKGGKEGASWGDWGKGGKGSPTTWQSWRAPSSTAPSASEGEAIGQFVGTVKSFGEKNGYGFIDCPELKTTYSNDVFLHGQQMGHFAVGDIVEFTAFLSKDGKPQARDLQAANDPGKRQRTED